MEASSTAWSGKPCRQSRHAAAGCCGGPTGSSLMTRKNEKSGVGDRDGRKVARVPVGLSWTPKCGLARPRPNTRGRVGYVQDGELARVQRQNRKQDEADDEARQGGRVEAAEDEQSIPSTHCRGKGHGSVASIRRCGWRGSLSLSRSDARRWGA